jgi:hypothetical protein
MSGVILATTDGGTTWGRQYISISSDLHSIYFPDANNGWAVGSDGSILYTGDGGGEITALAHENGKDRDREGERRIAGNLLFIFPGQEYEFAARDLISVAVFNGKGAIIRNIPADGRHRARWDGRDSRGRRVRAGMYFAGLKSIHGREWIKVVVHR